MSPSRRYSTLNLKELLDAFASNAPVPGGGSASALAGATGVALLIMVASMQKAGAAAQSADLAAAVVRLGPLRDALTSLIDRDSDAYSSVIDALCLPKGNDAEAAARRQALTSAMKGATDAPLEVMRICRRALADSLIVAAQGRRSAASDVGVAIELLRAAVRGASMNVDTNLPALSDAAYVDRVNAERQQLGEQSAADAERALALLLPAQGGHERSAV